MMTDLRGRPYYKKLCSLYRFNGFDITCPKCHPTQVNCLTVFPRAFKYSCCVVYAQCESENITLLTFLGRLEQ